MLTANLPSAFNVSCESIPLNMFEIYQSGQYIKLTMESYFGLGIALKYVRVNYEVFNGKFIGQLIKLMPSWDERRRVSLQCVRDNIAFVFKFYTLFTHSLVAYLVVNPENGLILSDQWTVIWIKIVLSVYKGWVRGCQICNEGPYLRRTFVIGL